MRSGSGVVALGTWLRQSRQIRGLTLTGIADAAEASNQSNLSKTERGAIIPGLKTIREIAPYYGSPWCDAAENAVFIHALVWIFSARVGFHPTTDGEVMAVSRVKSALAAADAVVNAAPDDAHAILHTAATTLSGVPGLAQMPWTDTRPFWVWIWMQQLRHVELARQRLVEDIEPEIDQENEEMALAFEAMRARLAHEENLLRRWNQWGFVWTAAESVRNALVDPKVAWYQFPRLDISDFVYADHEKSPLDREPAHPVDENPAESAIQSAWRNTVEELTWRGMENPELVRLIRTLLDYPSQTLDVLIRFLSHVTPVDTPQEDPDDLPF